MKTLVTRRGAIELPAFFPDATYGALRAAGFDDAQAARVPGVVMNTFHLYQRPGAKLVKSLGGLHSFCGWPGAILTDSGGFQLFSLIRENPSYGEIRAGEIIFRPDSGGKVIFTPEKCIQAQVQLGSDILMALDLCTHPDDPLEAQKRSVELTVAWGRRCRAEYDKLFARREDRPLLFGIVQGGGDRDLRLECGARLREIGFDGFGFGGWPLRADGTLHEDSLRYAAEAMDPEKPRYAMGVGRPEEIVRCVDMGYTLFDCVIPTREARHQRLYAFREGCDRPGALRAGSSGPAGRPGSAGSFYRFHYCLDDVHARDARPVDETCDCPLCARYSRAYLHHLFKLGDPQALRLATAHNLRFYQRLMALLRDGG